MKIKRFVLGENMTNCYIAGDGSDVAVIDPAFGADEIIKALEREKLRLCAILITHGHYDHTGALYELKEKTGAKVYIHRLDEPMLGDNIKNLAFMTGEKQKRCEPDILLEGGEKIEFGENTLSVLHTPGHSPGSVSYIGSGCVFSGDLIFKGSIGRFDFDGGSYSEELRSVKTLLEALSEDDVICPGHGEATTAGYEKKYNPYAAPMFKD